MDQRKLYIASAYIEPDADAAIEQLLQETQCSHVIIGGDFNGKSQLWGCNDADARGDAIVNLASGHYMDFCYIENTATFETVTHDAHRSSIIDVTLASDRIVD